MTTQSVNEDILTITNSLRASVDSTVDIGQNTTKFKDIYMVNSIGTYTIIRTAVNTSTYSILSSDGILGVTYTQTGSVVLTLPLSSSLKEGQTFQIIDEGGNATQNNITINRSGSDTINGDTSTIININYMSLSIYSISGKWYIF